MVRIYDSLLTANSCVYNRVQDYSDVSALLYTLRAVLGDGGLPTRPPNMELNSLVSGFNATTFSDSDERLQVKPGGPKTGKGRVTVT